MSEMNLLASNYSKNTLKKYHKRLFLSIVIIVLISLAVLIVVPICITKKIKANNRLIEIEIKDLDYVNREISFINKNRNEMEYKTNLINQALKNEVDISNVIDKIYVFLPEGAAITYLSISGEKVTLQGKSGDMEPIINYIYRIGNSELFTLNKIDEIISPTIMNPNYTFNCTFNICGNRGI